MSTSSALIVDQDRQLCRWMTRNLSSWSLTATQMVNPRAAYHDIQKNHYNVILLEACMPDVIDMDLLGNIGSISPQSKIIIMTDQNDTSIIINALQRGAFDFLEKPIELEMLRHVVLRALDVQRMELEQKELHEEIERGQKVLTEISEALSEVTKTVEIIRRVTETRMIQQMKSLILPLVEKLRQDQTMQVYESHLAQLSRLMDDIQSGYATHLQASSSLSVREWRTALMIKNGMTNQEIASQLHIALETVKAHRRNIRKKLGLTGTKCTLSAYLQSLDEDVVINS